MLHSKVKNFIGTSKFLEKGKKHQRDEHIAINYFYSSVAPWSEIVSKGITYIHHDSQIYRYFTDLYNQYINGSKDAKNNPLKDPRFTKALNRACYLQEHDPANKTAFLSQTAQLALFAAGLFDFQRNPWLKNFNFAAGQHAEFCHLISSCSSEFLIGREKYLQLEALQTNQYNITLSLKLLSINDNIIKDENKAIFYDTLKRITELLQQQNQNKKQIQMLASKLLLIAMGIWGKPIDERVDEKYIFNDINLANNPKFSRKLLSLDEKTLKQSWIKNTIAAMYDFPTTENLLTPEQKNHINTHYTKLNYDNFIFAIDNKPLSKSNDEEIKMAYKLSIKGRLYIENPTSLKFVKLTSDETYHQKIKEAKFTQHSGIQTLKPIRVWEIKMENQKSKFVVIKPDDERTIKNEYVVSPQEYILGKNFDEINDETSNFKKLYELLKGKSLMERSQLARALMMEIANLHNKNIFHGDIKGQNILINFRQNSHGKSIAEIRLTGLHFAEPISDPNSVVLPITFGKGTFAFAAPEIIKEGNAYGVSDIYSSTPILAAIFNANDPLEEKLMAGYLAQNKNEKTGDLVANALYSLEGLCKDLINTNGYSQHLYLKSCLENFINRCQHQNPAARPLDNEAQAFFNNLAIVTEIIEKNPQDIEPNTIYIHAAKLIFISLGLWNKEIPGTALKYNEFDYELDPSICKDLVDSHKESLQIHEANDDNANLQFYSVNLDEKNAATEDNLESSENLLEEVSVDESSEISSTPVDENLINTQKQLKEDFNSFGKLQYILKQFFQYCQALVKDELESENYFSTDNLTKINEEISNLLLILPQELLQQSNLIKNINQLNDNLSDFIDIIQTNNTQTVIINTHVDDLSNLSKLLMAQIDDKIFEYEQNLFKIIDQIVKNSHIIANENLTKTTEITRNFERSLKEKGVYKIAWIKNVITEQFKEYNKSSGVFESLTRSLIKIKEKDSQKVETQVLQILEPLYRNDIDEVNTIFAKQKQFASSQGILKASPLKKVLKNIEDQVTPMLKSK